MCERDLLVLRKRGTIVIGVKDKNLTEVTIPDGVVKLREGAFSDCKNLKHVHLPDSVKIIGDSVFRDCTSLQSVNLGQVQFIGNNAFNGCVSLQNISFSEGLEEIKDHSFENCSSLENVNLPAGLMSIGVKAFSGCKSLKQIIIGKDLDIIKTNAFWRCSALESIEVDQDNEAFTIVNGVLCTKDLKTVVTSGNRALNADEIPEGADLLKWGPFCETFIRNGVCVLGKDAQHFENKQFEGNQEIVKLVVTRQVNGIGMFAFHNCKNLREIVFDKGIDYIEASAFEGCEALERVTFPSSLTYLGASAFRNCVNLKRVNLPSGLKSILMNVFDGCVSLTDIDFEIVDINSHLFDPGSFKGVDRSKCTIHVPNPYRMPFEEIELSFFRGFNIDKREPAQAAWHAMQRNGIENL